MRRKTCSAWASVDHWTNSQKRSLHFAFRCGPSLSSIPLYAVEWMSKNARTRYNGVRVARSSWVAELSLILLLGDPTITNNHQRASSCSWPTGKDIKNSACPNICSTPYPGTLLLWKRLVFSPPAANAQIKLNPACVILGLPLSVYKLVVRVAKKSPSVRNGEFIRPLWDPSYYMDVRHDSWDLWLEVFDNECILQPSRADNFSFAIYYIARYWIH